MKKRPGFSVVHLNSRSLLAIIDKIEMCLEELDWLFDVITVPETWIKESVSSYTMLENYRMCHTHRQNKKGGGVAIYIKNNLDLNKIDVLSTSIEDVIMEIFTVEICIKQLKKIVICCIYKSPSVNYNYFNSKLESLFHKCQFNTKDVYVCGFNVDLIKHNENKGAQEFIDIMFNVGLHPVISKPTRITSSTNSLIDNIFTNCINDNIYSGLLINDLSDHLPIFIVNERNLNHNSSDYQPMHIEI